MIGEPKVLNDESKVWKINPRGWKTQNQMCGKYRTITHMTEIKRQNSLSPSGTPEASTV